METMSLSAAELPFKRRQLTFNPKEAADELGVGLTKVRELLRTGKLPHNKDGGVVMVPFWALTEYLQNGVEQTMAAHMEREAAAEAALASFKERRRAS